MILRWTAARGGGGAPCGWACGLWWSEGLIVEQREDLGVRDHSSELLDPAVAHRRKHRLPRRTRRDAQHHLGTVRGACIGRAHCVGGSVRKQVGDAPIKS